MAISKSKTIFLLRRNSSRPVHLGENKITVFPLMFNHFQTGPVPNSLQAKGVERTVQAWRKSDEWPSYVIVGDFREGAVVYQGWPKGVYTVTSDYKTEVLESHPEVVALGVLKKHANGRSWQVEGA